MKFRIVWAPAFYVISDTYDVNCMSAGGADQDGRGNEEFERLSRTNGSGCTLRGPEAPMGGTHGEYTRHVAPLWGLLERRAPNLSLRV